MIERPMSVRIDRLILRNLDNPHLDDMARLIAERFRRVSKRGTEEERPIPRSGRGMTEAAAGQIVRAVRRRIN